MNVQHEVIDEVHQKSALDLREEELDSIKGTRIEQEALRKAQKFMRNGSDCINTQRTHSSKVTKSSTYTRSKRCVICSSNHTTMN